MTVYYLDSIARVKHFLKEPGSSWIQQLFSGHERLFASATLGYIEVAVAIVRQPDVRKPLPTPSTKPSQHWTRTGRGLFRST